MLRRQMSNNRTLERFQVPPSRRFNTGAAQSAVLLAEPSQARRRERRMYTMHRSDQQPCPRSDRHTGMLMARNWGAVQSPAKRT